MLFSGILTIFSARVSISVSFQSDLLSFPYSSSLIHVSSSAVCILDATCISSSESGTGPALKEFLIPWCLSINLFV